jgi:hypothetical protein
MRTHLTTAGLLLIMCTPAAAQSLDIGAARTGISVGNSPVWTGLRINWSDQGVQRVTGINFTIWRPRENPDFRMTGLALGIAGPGAGTLNGVSAGLGGVVADEAIRGIALGGLGVVSQGTIDGAVIGGLGVVAEGALRGLSIAGLGVVSQGSTTGVTIAGLGTVSQGAMTGINVAGLGVVSEGAMLGLNAAGLGVVSQGSATGINLSGLGTVAQGDMTGVNVGGLAVVAEGRMHGLNIGGMALVADDAVRGVNIGGLAVVGNEAVEGISAALGAIESRELIRGATFGGYRVKAPNIDGLSAAIVMMRTEDLRGFSIAGYNEVRGLQTGLTIGLYNSADELHGVQIGLLNRAKNNRAPFRWLPLLNAHFD